MAAFNYECIAALLPALLKGSGEDVRIEVTRRIGLRCT